MLHTCVYFSRMCYQIAPRVLHFSAFIVLVLRVFKTYAQFSDPDSEAEAYDGQR